MRAILQPIPKKPLREEAYDALKRAIIEGSIKPGTQLSEPQLAEHFRISRSPIREALGRLEQEGFAQRKANGRLQVAPLDIEELEQLYVLRATVEGLATRLAAGNLSMNDLKQMAELLKKMESAAAAGNIEESLKQGAKFHDTILENCGNKPLIDVVDGVRLRIDRFRMVIASTRNQAARVAEHWRIYDALHDRDPESAEKAMIAHIQQSAETILKGVSSEYQPTAHI